MAAKKSAAPKKTKAKKAASPKKAPTKKPKTSSAPGESTKAHQWLMDSQGVSKEGLPEQVSSDEPNNAIEPDTGSAEPKQDRRKTLPHLFKPGQSGNPAGRKKGSRNKLAEAFIDDFYADWLEHGASVIAAVRAEKPDVYFKGAVAILPKQMDVRVSEFAELKDDALDGKIAEMQRELASAMAILNPQGSA